MISPFLWHREEDRLRHIPCCFLFGFLYLKTQNDTLGICRHGSRREMSEMYDLSQVGTQTDCVTFTGLLSGSDPVAKEQPSSLISLLIKASGVTINRFE